MRATVAGMFMGAVVALAGCKYQHPETGSEDRSIVTPIPKPYPKTTTSAGGLDRGPDTSDGAGTPRLGVIEGQLQRKTNNSVEVVAGGQTVRLMTDAQTQGTAALQEGAQVRAAYEVVGEEKLARELSPLP